MQLYRSEDLIDDVLYCLLLYCLIRQACEYLTRLEVFLQIEKFLEGIKEEHEVL